MSENVLKSTQQSSVQSAQPSFDSTLNNQSQIYSGNPLFSKFKNLKVVFGGVVGLVLLVITGYWVYATYFMSPLSLLKTALEKMEVDSIKLGFNTEAEAITANGTIIAHEQGFSQANISLGTMESGLQHDFNLSFIADMENVYFQMNYTYIQMLFAQADTIIPGISSTKTFALLQPVLTSQSWLHLTIPEEDQVTTDPDEYAAEYQEFGEKLTKSLVVKDFARNKEFNGEKYHIISLGVDKEKLLVAIDALKNLDLNAEVADINNLKKAIEDMGELKETLAVVYIDLAGYLRIIDLYAPQGSSESIQEVIEQEAGAKSPLMAQLSQLTAAFQPAKGAKVGEATKFMTITLSDYGSAEKVQAPTPTVEWDEVMLYAQSEFAPIFYQYMLLQQAQQGMMDQGGYLEPAKPDFPVETYPAETYPAGSMPGSDGMPINFMQLLNQ